MDFQLTDEQLMLQDSAQKFVERSYPFEKRRELADSTLGFGAENWRSFAELGWLALPFAEDSGGLGGGNADMMVLQEVLGQALVTEPIIPNVVLCGGLIERLGTSVQKDLLLGQLMAGDCQFALAHSEREAGSNPNYVACGAVGDGDSFRISGQKIMVLNGHAAETFLVTARISGADRDPQGIGLFLIDAETPGVEVTRYQTIDGLHAANLTLTDVSVPAAQRLGEEAADAIEAVIDQAILAAGAEAVGAMKALFDITLAYVKDREQFKVPIGSFQVLQHRLVDMVIAYEDCKSALCMATFCPPGDAVAARRAVSALKVKLAEAGRLIGEQAIQLHGAVGTTDELNVGYYYKRLLVIEQLFGSTAYHLDRYARLGQG